MRRKILLCAGLLLLSHIMYAQFSTEYTDWVKKAMAFYDAKQYQQSADAFGRAFASNGWKGSMDDRYNAACSWAMAGNKDSAFYNLNRIATKANYADMQHLSIDTDLESLHADKRWKALCAQVQKNKDKAEENLDKPLVHILDTIYTNDQMYRMQIDEVGKKYGNSSKEMTDLWKTINYNDSLNLIKVETILDKRGWLGPDVVGPQGNNTLFLVIQHANLRTQDKYLPMMRDAVKAHKAQPSALALLEDRDALGHGKKQIYGSQVIGDLGSTYLAPMIDPDNVDKRRAEVGLNPLAEYLQNYQMKWDVEEYKRQLPEIEKKTAQIYHVE